MSYITQDKNSDAVFAHASTLEIACADIDGRVEVSVGAYLYTVILPDSSPAYIAYRYGSDGTQYLKIIATSEQDRLLRTARRPAQG
ncbi:hypothetical protein GCM10009733_021070 [Nonomuraea maheshkhaliensis]|uniref:Uncharacterized protein n=1 Tax=Nonomuraea maheshkhaliensis TaxID=419590 RepID=A0ABP4QYA5_9ACTN